MNREASMVEVGTTRRPVLLTTFRVLAVFDTVALLFAASLHVQGVRISLGSAVFDEPQIVPAAIVEGLAGLIFAVAAYALLANRRWMWSVTLGAHLFAILGFVVGIVATRNGTSPFNHIYHYVMLGVFIVGLALLLLLAARAALGRDSRGPRTERYPGV